jgi:hypothetical protein
MVAGLDYNSFLPNPSQFIIQLTIYTRSYIFCSTLSDVKQTGRPKYKLQTFVGNYSGRFMCPVYRKITPQAPYAPGRATHARQIDG